VKKCNAKIGATNFGDKTSMDMATWMTKEIEG
jgi:hypothetical protein